MSSYDLDKDEVKENILILLHKINKINSKDISIEKLSYILAILYLKSTLDKNERTQLEQSLASTYPHLNEVYNTIIKDEAKFKLAAKTSLMSEDLTNFFDLNATEKLIAQETIKWGNLLSNKNALPRNQSTWSLGNAAEVNPSDSIHSTDKTSNPAHTQLIKTFESKLSEMQTQIWFVWLISPFFSSFYEDCQFKIRAYEILIADLKNNAKISAAKSKDFNLGDQGGSTVEKALGKNTGICRLWSREGNTSSKQLLVDAEKNQTNLLKK
jgi:hypothetical protein